jgi:hypothetical protein
MIVSGTLEAVLTKCQADVQYPAVPRQYREEVDRFPASDLPEGRPESKGKPHMSHRAKRRYLMAMSSPKTSSSLRTLLSFSPTSRIPSNRPTYRLTTPRTSPSSSTLPVGGHATSLQSVSRRRTSGKGGRSRRRSEWRSGESGS